MFHLSGEFPDEDEWIICVTLEAPGGGYIYDLSPGPDREFDIPIGDTARFETVDQAVARVVHDIRKGGWLVDHPVLQSFARAHTRGDFD